MTLSMKRSVINLVIWCIVLLVFVPLFFYGGGPAQYVHETWRLVIMAIVFGVGYVSFMAMLVLTREKKLCDQISTDERDEVILGRANGLSHLLVMGYVFILSIILYEWYHDQACVPVGWMWFVGYTSVFVGYIVHSIATIVLNYRMGGWNDAR